MSTLDRNEEFEQMLREHQSQLFSFIFSLLRSFSDAEDVFQRTSLVLWRKFDSLTPGANFMTWACAVARYEVLNHLKSSQRQHLSLSDEAQSQLVSLQEHTTSREIELRREALAGCVERLPESQRTLIRSFYGDGKRGANLGEQFGRTMRSVHGSLRHIRHKLLECIDRKLRRDEGA